MLVQIAPRDTRSRNPENPIQNKTVIPRSTPAAGATLNHKWLKTRPFLVAHQTTNQDSLPESYLESEITLVENPLCQHVLALQLQFLLISESLGNHDSGGQGRPLVMLLSEGQMSDYKGAALMFDALPKAKVSWC
jgi:hypothetical protein